MNERFAPVRAAAPTRVVAQPSWHGNAAAIGVALTIHRRRPDQQPMTAGLLKILVRCEVAARRYPLGGVQTPDQVPTCWPGSRATERPD